MFVTAPAQWLVRELSFLPDALRPGLLLAAALLLVWFVVAQQGVPRVWHGAWRAVAVATDRTVGLVLLPEYAITRHRRAQGQGPGSTVLAAGRVADDVLEAAASLYQRHPARDRTWRRLPLRTAAVSHPREPRGMDGHDADSRDRRRFPLSSPRSLIAGETSRAGRGSIPAHGGPGSGHPRGGHRRTTGAHAGARWRPDGHRGRRGDPAAGPCAGERRRLPCSRNARGAVLDSAAFALVANEPSVARLKLAPRVRRLVRRNPLEVQATVRLTTGDGTRPRSRAYTLHARGVR